MYYPFQINLLILCSKESGLVLYAGLIRAAALALMIVFVNIVMYITFTIYVAKYVD